MKLLSLVSLREGHRPFIKSCRGIVHLPSFCRVRRYRLFLKYLITTFLILCTFYFWPISTRNNTHHLPHVDTDTPAKLCDSNDGDHQTYQLEACQRAKLAKISEMIQRRLAHLQTPKNCSAARKLLCHLEKDCGFGCQIHHVVYCLVVAYATGRTLLLYSLGWRYGPLGWKKKFLPLTSCDFSSVVGQPAALAWGDENATESTPTVFLPVIDIVNPKPPYIPPTVPSEFAEELSWTEEPGAWWVGQFLQYILKPQQDVREYLKREGDKAKDVRVGLHVRRTDKIGKEAESHALSEYMRHVVDHFHKVNKSGNQSLPKRIFIATDDPSVVVEAKEMYSLPEWEMIADENTAKSANVKSRNSGFLGVLRDITLLSQCDFIVCTFSSQVCRLAYELQQARVPGWSTKPGGSAVSLDAEYYYGGGDVTAFEATASHLSSGETEVDFEKGDRVEKLPNAPEEPIGFLYGRNNRTGKVGQFPTSKLKRAVQYLDFPVNKWW